MLGGVWSDSDQTEMVRYSRPIQINADEFYKYFVDRLNNKTNS